MKTSMEASHSGRQHQGTPKRPSEAGFLHGQRGRIQEAADFCNFWTTTLTALRGNQSSIQRVGRCKEAVDTYDFAIAIEDSFALPITKSRGWPPWSGWRCVGRPP